MRSLNRNFHWLVALSLLLPFGAGLLLTGSLAGGLTALLWGGLVRVFFVHHVTWSINSICHYHGARRFETDDESTNVWWLSVLSLGESWHHNHHAFPRSAVHGLRRFEIDPSGLVIGAMQTPRARLERRPDHARAPGPEARGADLACIDCAADGDVGTDRWDRELPHQRRAGLRRRRLQGAAAKPGARVRAR